ncbi:hypothetical protein Gpo141_00008114 [Globisporangium polare]
MDAYEHEHEHDEQEPPVWKVSHTLDQLDILAEQHHLQMEHHDGLPDWPSHPRDPAGVASEAHLRLPPNFAWSKEFSSRDSRVAHAPPQQKEAQLLPSNPTELVSPSPAPLGFANTDRRHFRHAEDETLQSQRDTTKRHYDTTPGDRCW